MKKAFSLIEIVVVMAILIVIIGTIASITMSSSKSFSSATVLATLQDDAVTMNQIYQNEIRNASSVNILETKPSVLEENIEYIFVETDTDTNTNTVMVKEAGSTLPPVPLLVSENQQEVLFKKINENTIAVELTLVKGDETFNVTTTNVFENMPENVEVTGESGTCLAFNYAEKSIFLKQFMFTRDRNGFLDTDAVGVIDEVNKTVTVTVNTSDFSNLKPSITILGDSVCFDNKYNEKYDTSNPTSLDFTDPRTIFVFGEDGSYKTYEIIVASAEVHTIENLSIIPLEKKTDDPTDKKNIVMPTASSFLYAQYEGTEGYDNATINWYAAKSVADIKAGSSKWTLISSSKDRALDVSKIKNNALGKYVFFEVKGKSGTTPAYSVAAQYLSDKVTYTPYVYVQLDYGNLWDTTLNEIDYQMDRKATLSYTRTTQFTGSEKINAVYGDKVEAIENAYSKSESFRESYTKYDTTGEEGIILIGATQKDKTKFSGHIKCVIMDSSEFLYKVDYVKKDVRVQGNRQGGIAGYYRDYLYGRYMKAFKPYPVGYGNFETGAAALELTHYAILSVNRYHKYYKDRSTDTDWSSPYIQNNGVRVGIVNTFALYYGHTYNGVYKVPGNSAYISDSVDVNGDNSYPYTSGWDTAGELTGFAISPNSSVRVDDYNRRIYSNGYFYEFNLYAYRLGGYELPGVTMYDINESKVSNNYLSAANVAANFSPSIGAHSAVNSYSRYYMPYTFSDIKNGTAFSADNSVEEYDYANFTVDLFTKRKGYNMPIVEVDMYRGTNVASETELQSRKSKKMYFGDFTQYEGTDSAISTKNNTYTVNGATVYGANTPTTVETKTAQGKNHLVLMDYDTKMNQSSRRNVTITAWTRTLNNQYGPLGYGNLDFLITDIQTLNTPR